MSVGSEVQAATNNVLHSRTNAFVEDVNEKMVKNKTVPA